MPSAQTRATVGIDAGGAALNAALDRAHRERVNVLDRFECLGPAHRRRGGQGCVQFVFDPADRKVRAAAGTAQRIYLPKKTFSYRRNSVA
jgi:hypothetical protein